MGEGEAEEVQETTPAPEEEAAEETPEEEEVVCPLPEIREKCTEHHCQSLKDRLDTCNDRVNSRTETEETCHEEMLDFMHCVDHCAMPKLFQKLK